MKFRSVVVIRTAIILVAYLNVNIFVHHRNTVDNFVMKIQWQITILITEYIKAGAVYFVPALFSEYSS